MVERQIMSKLWHWIFHKQPLSYGMGCHHCDGQRLMSLFDAARDGLCRWEHAAQAIREVTKGRDR